MIKSSITVLTRCIAGFLGSVSVDIAVDSFRRLPPIESGLDQYLLLMMGLWASAMFFYHAVTGRSPPLVLRVASNTPRS